MMYPEEECCIAIMVPLFTWSKRDNKKGLTLHSCTGICKLRAGLY